MKRILLLMTLCAGHSIIGMQAPNENYMLLHAAASKGETALCRKLIQEGANVNEKAGPRKSTPLYFAITGNHANTCGQLIASGAELDIVNEDVLTPLNLAALHNRVEIVKILLTTPLRSEYKRIRAARCGLIALRYAQPALPRDIRLLLDQKLIHSFTRDHINRIKEFLTNSRGDVARPLALSMGHNEIAQMLNLNDPNSYTLIETEIKSLIRRLLIPKPKAPKPNRQRRKLRWGSI